VTPCRLLTVFQRNLCDRLPGRNKIQYLVGTKGKKRNYTCSLIDHYQHFGEMRFLHLQDRILFYTEDKDNIFIRNTGRDLLDYKLSYRKQSTLYCEIRAQRQSCETSRHGRCYGTALYLFIY
jgi:hypothetical protein